ncbi:unnamed protein product [Amoebophrya sp. A25]|nr:unnamed protein product [Amoebophrya sp. A25]|eukprot:GSA25T00010371001.1
MERQKSPTSFYSGSSSTRRHMLRDSIQSTSWGADRRQRSRIDGCVRMAASSSGSNSSLTTNLVSSRRNETKARGYSTREDFREKAESSRIVEPASTDHVDRSEKTASVPGDERSSASCAGLSRGDVSEKHSSRSARRRTLSTMVGNYARGQRSSNMRTSRNETRGQSRRSRDYPQQPSSRSTAPSTDVGGESTLAGCAASPSSAQRSSSSEPCYECARSSIHDIFDDERARGTPKSPVPEKVNDAEMSSGRSTTAYTIGPDKFGEISAAAKAKRSASARGRATTSPTTGTSAASSSTSSRKGKGTMISSKILNARSLLATFLISCQQFLLVSAKVANGVVTLGNRNSPLAYVSKMGYDIGEGTYAVRFKLLRPVTTMERAERLKVAIFLDEEWEEHDLDRKVHNWDYKDPNAKSICDYMKYAKTTRDVSVPGGMTPDWSGWEKGGLKQVIRPHVWYFVASDCPGEGQEWTGESQIGQAGQLKLRFQFEAKQHDGSHFSKEMDGMLTVYMFKLLLFGCYGVHYVRLCVAHRQHAIKVQVHPCVWVLTLVIGLQFVATVLSYFHLWSYSVNGTGIRILDVVQSICQAISQVLIQNLLLLISMGYTLLQSSLGELDLIVPVTFIVIVINVLLVAFSKAKEDASYKFYENEGYTGWLMLLIRFALYAWFVYSIMATRRKAPAKIGNFLDKFTWAGTLYFLSFPIVFLVASLFAAYLRHKVMVIGGFCTFALSVRWLENLFLKKGEFYQVSTLGSSILPGGVQWGFAKGE